MNPILVHSLRTVAAALLAMGLAYLFEVDTPYSAATTVLIVAHPMHGMILSKSLYRLGGTLVGAGMAILLMALFAQSPEMFVLGLSLWMGLCTIASTLLRGFRSYGAVLAGYTVALITLPGVDTPEKIFDLSVSRVSVVTLGIACSALVASLTTRRAAEQTLSQKLRGTVGRLAGYARQCLTGAPAAGLSAQRPALASEIAGLDALVEFAAIETAVGMSSLEDRLRASAIAMYGVLTTAASAHEALERLEPGRRPDELVDAFSLWLERLQKAEAADLGGLRGELVALCRRLEEALAADDLGMLTALDRLSELADEFLITLDGALDLAGLAQVQSQADPNMARRVRLHRHRDWNWAAINGLRACLAIWLAGAIWIVTAWPAGASMVAMIVPNVGLLAMRDRPASDAAAFVVGTLLASAVGLFYLLWLLPMIDGFPLLALSMAVPLVVGVMMSMRPATAFVGIGFYVFFITLLAPSNPMVYAPEFFLNNALATVSGAALTAVIYRTVLPIDPRRHVRTLVRAMQTELAALLQGRIADGQAWEGGMHDRLIQLGGRMRAAGIWRQTLMRGGFAALRLGREVMRLRILLAGDAEAHQACAEARQALATLGSAPHAALLACRASVERLRMLASSRGPEEAKAPLRAAVSLQEVALLLGRNRRFFQGVSA